MSSYSEWERGIANRNYHIFRYLLNDERVKRIIAVDFLPFTLKRAVRNYLENIVSGPKGKIVYRDWTTKCTKISDKLFIFSTIDSYFFSKIVIKKLNLVLSKIPQLSVPRIVWSYFPMFVDYFGQINESLTVFDTVDNWLEHPSYFKYKEKLKMNYQIIAQKSDLIFTVAESLIDFFKNLGREKDVYWVANGVDLEHFQKITGVPKDIQKIPRPIIGYIGTIQNRVDINLLEYLAQKNPDKSLVLVGPTWPEFLKKFRRPAIEIQRLKKYKNVYFLGRKPYQESPNYIHQFDVAIIPHKLDEFIKYTHSLKLLEYLACGKPVVTTPASGVEKFSHLVYITQDYRDFNEKIQKALSENKPELGRLRIEVVKEYFWQSKIEQIMEIINEKLEDRHH
ncbi:MAG: glycosyltransferase [Patescibacteria group bacterium]